MDKRKEFNRKQRRYLKEHPICVRCGCNATEVHHVTPLIFEGTNEDDNLASMCHACHKEWDIWEAGWIGKHGPVNFDKLLDIFCCSPSTKIIAALLMFGSDADGNGAASDKIAVRIIESLNILSSVEFEFNAL